MMSPSVKAPISVTVRYCVDACRPFARYLIPSFLCVIAGVIVGDVATPLVFADALQKITTLTSSDHLWSTFGGLITLYAGLLVVSTCIWRGAGWLEWEGCTRAFSHAIAVSFNRLLELGYRWHVDHPSGEVSSTLGTFSWSLMEGIDQLTWGILRIAVGVLCAIVVLLFVAWPVGIIVAVFTAGFITVVVHYSKPVARASEAFSAAHSKAEGAAFDAIRNISTVLAQSGQEMERARVRAFLDESVRADLVARRIFTVTRTWMETVLSVMTWGALFVGVALALNHDIHAGVVYLVLFYAASVSNQVSESFESVRSISRSLGRATKLVGLVTSEREIVDTPHAPDLAVSEGRLEFDAISFAYTPDRPLIKGLTLDVAPGEHVGVVGPSGGGKSTLTRLVLRFMELSDGEIRIDGQSIRDVNQISLRHHISYVPQDPQMLFRTIAENIWFGRTDAIDLDRIEEVARAAHVHDFVEELPEGYHTMVGERGLKLSGGQRQRVAIAQAMLKGAKILILDEATSALDSESERLVQDALWKLMARSTSLVVAHRLSTISHLDRIIVVENGAVTESGSHQELLGRKATYHRLWAHQSGGFLE